MDNNIFFSAHGKLGLGKCGSSGPTAEAIFVPSSLTPTPIRCSGVRGVFLPNAFLHSNAHLIDPHLPSLPRLRFVSYNNPFLASSTFLAASSLLKPPFEIQILLPSPSSNLSSCAGKAHGQWCGKATQERVPGQR